MSLFATIRRVDHFAEAVYARRITEARHTIGNRELTDNEMQAIAHLAYIEASHLESEARRRDAFGRRLDTGTRR